MSDTAVPSMLTIETSIYLNTKITTFGHNKQARKLIYLLLTVQKHRNNVKSVVKDILKLGNEECLERRDCESETRPTRPTPRSTSCFQRRYQIWTHLYHI